MRFRIPEYNGSSGIISLALDETTKMDLLADQLDFWYITDNKIVKYPENIVISDSKDIIEMVSGGSNYDVFVVRKDGLCYRCYDDKSMDNIFFITNQCNSNCIMCPSPEGSRKGGGFNVDMLMSIASHMPDDTPHITITGGEPFLAGKRIFDFFEFIKGKFQKTEFLLLTNGRVFAIEEYCRRLKETLPAYTLIGIPLHGSNADTHDQITRAPGSFRQTVTGIKRLIFLGFRIEIRIVVSRLNCQDLYQMAQFIVTEFKGIEVVTIMAMEMTGNAFVNRDRVWIPYKETEPLVKEAVHILIHAGIDVRLYNYPLCTIDKELWTICANSISKDKIRYDEKCAACNARKACGGVFAGTLNLVKSELEPINETEFF